MKIEHKLAKIDSSISIEMYDNGYMFNVSGETIEENWATAKIICSGIEELIDLIREASTFTRRD